MRFAALTSFFVFVVVGCTTGDSRRGEVPTTAEWKKGDFRVRFQAGPQGQEGRSYSFYEVTHSFEGQQRRSIVMESAHSLGGFLSVTNGDPKNWIRIVQDPNGRALLIEEDIPNECGPCSNYLWVHVDPHGVIEGTYLQLPSKVTGPPGGIDYEYPKVRILNGDVLRYDYSTSVGVTEHVDRVATTDHPKRPG